MRRTQHKTNNGILQAPPGVPHEEVTPLAVTHIVYADDVLGTVHDKSTWARQGLAAQTTVIEPGWRGYLTLELTNHGYSDIILKDGMPIAQIIFWKMSEPTEIAYRGKYQDQPSGAQPALFD